MRSWSLHLGLPGGGWAPTPADVFDLTGGTYAMRFEDGNADGRPDLVAAGSSHQVVGAGGSGGGLLGLAFAVHQLGPWTDAGFALPSAAGEPFLWTEGTLLPGSAIGLVVRDAAPNKAVTLIAGLAPAMTPFKGGTLVPSPLLALSLGVTGPAGLLETGGTWPSGVPAGTQLWMQAWVKDASAPAGYAATNGVAGTAP